MATVHPSPPAPPRTLRAETIKEPAPRPLPFLKFEVSGIGSTISKAVVDLYVTDESDSAGSICLNFK